MRYDKAKNGWNLDWETDNIPDDISDIHRETCPICDMPKGECREPMQCLGVLTIRLKLAEDKLAEFGQEWDGKQQYVFNGKD